MRGDKVDAVAKLACKNLENDTLDNYIIARYMNLFA